VRKGEKAEESATRQRERSDLREGKERRMTKKEKHHANPLKKKLEKKDIYQELS
jgi:hypothetical protein